MALQILSYVEKLLPFAQDFTIKKIKEQLIFHQLCEKAGIDFYEDDFDFAYLHSIAIFLSTQEKDWGIIFKIAEVRSAFKRGYRKRDYSEFNAIVNYHLHVTIKNGPLKELNTTPENLAKDFETIYAELIQDHITPSTLEGLKVTNELKQEFIHNAVQNDNSHQFTQQLLRDLAGTVQSLKNDAIPKSEYEQFMDSDHQAQLDLIKKLIDKYEVEAARENLFELKDRIWFRATNQIKFKVLNNIGFTYALQDDLLKSLDYYEQAAVFDPDNLNNLTNMVGIYFSYKRFDKIEPIAERLKITKPGIAKALELYRNESLAAQGNLESLITDDLMHDQEVIVALINLYLKLYPLKALDYAYKLYDTKRDSDNFKDIYCNLVCVALIGERIDFETTELQELKNVKIIEYADELLVELWNKYSNSDLRKFKLTILEKRGLILTVLGKHQEAINVADEILKIKPEAYHSAKQRGMNLMYLKKYAEATECFNKIAVTNGEAWEYLMAWLISLAKSEGLSAAQLKADRYLREPDCTADDRQRILSTLSFLYIDEQEYPTALSIVNIMEDEFPNQISIIADKASILEKIGSKEQYEEYLGKLLDLSQNGFNTYDKKDLCIVANYLMRAGKFNEAAIIFQSFVEIKRDHYLTMQLAECYHKSGNKEKALAIYETLRDNNGVGKYTLNEAEIYYFYHDYAKTLEVMSLYNEKFPEDQRTRINLIGLNIKLKHIPAAMQLLEKGFPIKDMPVTEIKVLAEIMIKLGLYVRGLDILYDYRRLYPSAKINSCYMSYCLYDPTNREQVEAKNEVEVDCVVKLESKGSTFHYVVEDKPANEVNHSKGEINLSDPIYLAMAGKTVGAKVNLGSGKSAREWTINEIFPKYRYAFHSAMNENQTIFSTETDSFSGYIADIKELDDLIGEQIKNQQKLDDFSREHEENYVNYQLPLSAFASFRNKNTIELYEYFMHKSGIKYSVGNVGEYTKAISFFNESPYVVADITTLLTLYFIGFDAKRLIPSIEIVTSYPTIDLINELYFKRESSSKADHMSIFEENGERVRMIVTAESKIIEFERLSSFKQWVENNARPLPCKLLLKFDDEKNDKFKSVLGSDVFEVALLGQEYNAPFLYDDAAGRRIIGEEYRFEGAWTQPFLKWLELKGLITSEDYISFLVKLCSLKFTHTGINTQDILNVIKIDEGKLSDNLELIVSILNGQNSDDRSIFIAFGAIAEIWNLAITEKRKDELSYFILMTFMIGRPLSPLMEMLPLHVDYFIKDFQTGKKMQKIITRLRKDFGYKSKLWK
ncbi:tetratricopeptide repeat protein [Mucilaginibacter pedocola]|uniref:Tetratricopeptide repeat protein n=1 Tax=Mucilaginibacter pedocola TaxID=1792845 RepID=A0A1S9P8S6_9SPHI|nr:hypothetical protein [Mucilaginibacter pedocola]OOQ57361.1 hypothetical protein BC343_14755 [Mucilaginibacter pedocola]